MDLERERGITIKSSAVTMYHQAADGETYQLNLIDTPGHVDFSYEVSRALAACEGALLVVDASQGIEAQTIANTLLAMEYDLDLIPVLNKVDLPQAEPERVAGEIEQVFGFRRDEVLFVSAKEGTGASAILDAVVERIPPPGGKTQKPARALVFDSVYNQYKGIIAHIRVEDGEISSLDRIKVMSSGRAAEIVEVGVFAPAPTPTDKLETGQVGYVATGFKDVRECTVGDTLTIDRAPATDPLPGYVPLKSMVFAGLYPSDGEQYGNLRTALEKLQLNDASLTIEPENSAALGFGFRCGFLGLMHLEIVQERLEREYDLDLIVTAPSVAYQVTLNGGEVIKVDSPAKLPSPNEYTDIEEPVLDLTIVAPSRYVGTLMELMHSRRSEFKRMEYIQTQFPLPSGEGQGEGASQDNARVMMEYTMPLGGDAGRLLQSIEVAHPRLRLAGLHLHRLSQSPAGQGGRAGQPYARRGPVHDSPPRPGHEPRPPGGGEAAHHHPPPAIRGAYPGRHRQPHHRPRDRPRHAQGRARQVLRRRHNPQAQAAGTPEGRQETPQDGRPGGNPPRGVPDAAGSGWGGLSRRTPCLELRIR